MTPGVPDFSGWPVDRLRAHRKQLQEILLVSVGQNDPVRAELRAEFEAAHDELSRRARRETATSETPDPEEGR
jgi:hypothetical protein